MVLGIFIQSRRNFFIIFSTIRCVLFFMSFLLITVKIVNLINTVMNSINDLFLPCMGKTDRQC